MNIINSEIISSELDGFWTISNENVKTLTVTPVLVLSSAIASESARGLLHRMISACGLVAGEFSIVEMPSNSTVAWYRLREIAQPKVVLLFGITLPSLGISALFKLCEPNRFDNVIWIPAPALEILEQDAEMRKMLWQQGMKLVFVDHQYGNLLNK